VIAQQGEPESRKGRLGAAATLPAETSSVCGATPFFTSFFTSFFFLFFKKNIRFKKIKPIHHRRSPLGCRNEGRNERQPYELYEIRVKEVLAGIFI
jgi:hypothetical protein